MKFLNRIFKKDTLEEVIYRSCKKHSICVKLITGNYEFAIRNFKLLNKEYIDIVGNMSKIEFIFINKGNLNFINDEEINNSKVTIYKLDECPICCDETNIKYLDCGHGICEKCATTIFNTYQNNNRKCPICKAKMSINYDKIVLKKKEVFKHFKKRKIK